MTSNSIGKYLQLGTHLTGRGDDQMLRCRSLEQTHERFLSRTWRSLVKPVHCLWLATHATNYAAFFHTEGIRPPPTMRKYASVKDQKMFCGIIEWCKRISCSGLVSEFISILSKRKVCHERKSQERQKIKLDQMKALTVVITVWMKLWICGVTRDKALVHACLCCVQRSIETMNKHVCSCFLWSICYISSSSTAGATSWHQKPWSSWVCVPLET